MKTLYIVPILAVVFAMAGCTSGSTGKTVYVTEEMETESEALPAEVTAPLEVTIVTPDEPPAPLKPAHIDAASFLDALIESGCVIDKAAYKEVARGGGIVVTCRATETQALEIDGLSDL